MTTTTPNMSLVLPALGSDPGVWDTYNNNALTTVDAHTHAAGSGVLIRPNAIGINDDLTFAGYSATNLRAAVFTAQASFATALAIYVKTNDLYFRDGASNEVRLTSSGALNIATTGGIAGDYIAASAQVYYDDANKTYRFLEAAPPNNWSYVACGGVDLYQQGLGITNRVRLSSPNALAASYEWVWPAALPASNALVQVSAAGVLTTSNTVTKAVTMTEVTTFSAGATCAAGQHFTVSAAGRYKHGSLVKNISAQSGYGTSMNFGSGYMVSAGAAGWWVAVPFDEGERLTAYSFRIYGDAAADCPYEINVYDTSATKTTLVSSTVTNPGAAWQTEAAGATHTFASGSCLVLEFSPNAANIRLGNISLTYDRP